MRHRVSVTFNYDQMDYSEVAHNARHAFELARRWIASGVEMPDGEGGRLFIPPHRVAIVQFAEIDESSAPADHTET